MVKYPGEAVLSEICYFAGVLIEGSDDIREGIEFGELEKCTSKGEHPDFGVVSAVCFKRDGRALIDTLIPYTIWESSNKPERVERKTDISYSPMDRD